MLLNWLKIAFANYKKNWLSTLINILGLSFGLAIFLLVFINWLDEKSYEKWVPNKENIFMLEYKNSAFGYMTSSSYPMLEVSKERFKEIEDFAIGNIWYGNKQRLNYGNISCYVDAGSATSSYFEFFPYEKIAGNYKDALQNDNQIALSEETAKLLFGKNYKNCIGKTVVQDNNGKSYLISAVYKLPTSNTVFKPGYLTHPEGIKDNKDQWLNFSYIGFFKLKPNTDVVALQDKLSNQLQKEEKIMSEKWGEKYDEKNKTEVFLTSLSTMKLDAQGGGIDKGDKKNILILMGLSVLILVLSAINLINLKTAQSSQRAKEVGVRKAIGSTKNQLILQFLLETFILCVFSCFLAFALVELLLPFYSKFLGKEIQIENLNLYGYALLIVIFLSLLSGIIPAIYLSNFKPINTLKGNFSRSSHGVFLRNSILTLQLIISSFFIISSLIINSQVNHMMNKDLGFKGDQTIQIDFKKTDWRQKDFNKNKYERLRNEVKNIRGVTDVTGSVLTIGNGYTNMSSVKNAEDTTKVINSAGLGAIELNYFKFYKIKFASGRDFDLRKTSDTISGAVINETFAKQMGWNNENALEKEFIPGWDGKKKYKVIGVVKDFYFQGVHAPVVPVAFFNYERNWAKNNMHNLQIKVSKDDIEGTLKRIEKFWKEKAEPGYPFDYHFVDKHFAKTFEQFKKQRILFTILNSVVLIVALLGLFALSSLLIEQKLKDVAIKKILGASEKSIVLDLTKKFLIISAIAVLISIPISYYFMNEWLKDFAYRIEMPWFPYVLSFVILLLLTFAVVSIKAYRATQVNLVKYLKYE